MADVLITTGSFGRAGKEPLRLLSQAGLGIVHNPSGQTLQQAQIKRLLAMKSFVGLIAGTETLSSAVLAKAPQLRVISRVGIGIDQIDLDYCRQKRIAVRTTRAGLEDAVAELTVGLLLAAMRAITLTDHRMRHGIWRKEMGSLLRGKRVGIIGFGHVGRRVAQLVKGFGVDLQFADARRLKARLPQVSLDRLLKTSDVVTLHASASHCLLGKTEISKMKRGSVLVNTSRGSLVDEEALYKALKNGRLGSAALDVYQKEPYYGKFAALDNVVLTPHIGSYAVETRFAMECEAAANLIAALKKAGVR